MHFLISKNYVAFCLKFISLLTLFFLNRESTLVRFHLRALLAQTWGVFLRSSFYSIFFQNHGTPMLFSLADAKWCLTLSCLPLSCVTQDRSLICLKLLVTLTIVSLHKRMSLNNIIRAKCEMDIHIYWKGMMRWNILKQNRQKRRGKTRQDKTRRHPEKNVFPGFEKLCRCVEHFANMHECVTFRVSSWPATENSKPDSPYQPIHLTSDTSGFSSVSLWRHRHLGVE